MKRHVRTCIFLVVIVLPVMVGARDLSIDRKIAVLQKRLVDQQKLKDQLGNLHYKLASVRNSLTEVERRSTEIMQDNVAKITLKGGDDLVQKLGATTSVLSFAVSTCIDLANSLYIGKKMADAIKSDYHDQQVKTDEITKNLKQLAARNGVIGERMEALRRVVKADIAMFDTDVPYFANNPATAPYWPKENREADNDDERIMRKLTITQRLGAAIAKNIDREMKQVRGDRRTADKLMARTRAEIGRLNAMQDTWDYTGASKPAPRLKISAPVKNSRNYAYCAREHMFDPMYNSDHQKLKDKQRLLKAYAEGGYRYQTRLVIQFPAETRLGEKLD